MKYLPIDHVALHSQSASICLNGIMVHFETMCDPHTLLDTGLTHKLLLDAVCQES